MAAPVRREPVVSAGRLGWSALGGVVTTASAFLAAAVLVGMTVVLGVLSASGSSDPALPPGSDNPLGSNPLPLGSDVPISQDDVQFDGNPLFAPVQWLAVLGMFGRLSGRAGLSVLDSMDAEAGLTVGFVPVGVLLAAVGGAAWWTFRLERRRPVSPRDRWVSAGVSGLATGVVALLLSLAGRAGLSTDVLGTGSAATVEVSTVGAASFFGPVLVGGLAARLGSWLAQDRGADFWRSLWRAPSRFWWGLRDVYDYLVVLAVVSAVAAVALGLVELSQGVPLLAALPLGVGFVAASLLSIAHGGSISWSAQVPWGDAGFGSQGSVGLGEVGSEVSVVWILVAVLTAILAAAVAGLAVGTRRVRSPLPMDRAWALPVMSGAAALAFGIALGSASLTGGWSGLGQDTALAASVTPGLWSALVAMLWGAAVEAFARWVAPTLLVTWPVLGRLRLAGGPARPPVAAEWHPPLPAAGTPAAGPAPSTLGTPTGRPVRALSPRARRRVLIGGVVGGVLVVVGIAGAGAISALRATVFSPRPVVEAYVADVAAGNYASAWNATTTQQEGGTALVEADHLQLSSAMSDVEIGDPDGAGDVRTVPVSWTVDGQRDAAPVTVSSTGRRYVFFDDWRVEGGLETTMTVSTGSEGSLTIGGVEAVLPPEQTTDLIAYPGVYPVDVAQSRWLSVATTSAAVGTAGGSVDASVSASPELLAEVQRQVDEQLDDCAKSEDPEPADCPFSVPAFGSDVRDVHWTIADYPTVDMVGVTDFSFSDGEVSVTYQERYPFADDWEDQTYGPMSLYGDGTVTIDGDQVTVTRTSGFGW